MAHLAFVFCCLVWGSTFILLERVTHAYAPIEIAIWRLASGAAIVGVAWWYQSRDFKLSRRDWGHLIFIALAATAPPQVIQPYVLAQGFGHGFFGTLVAPIPLLTILVSIPMLGIWPSRRQFLGVLGGLACIWLIVEDGFDRGMSFWLIAIALVIPLSSACSNTYIKWKLPHVPAAPLTAVILSVAAMSLIPLEFSRPAVESLSLIGPAQPNVTPTAVAYLLALGIIGSGISTLVFIWMILKEGPLFAGMTTYVVPVIALLWGQFDRETVSPQQLIAIVGVLSMVALVQFGSRRPVVLPETAGAPETVTLPGIAAEAVVLAEQVQPSHRTAAAIEYNSSNGRATQPNSQVA